MPDPPIPHATEKTTLISPCLRPSISCFHPPILVRRRRLSSPYPPLTIGNTAAPSPSRFRSPLPLTVGNTAAPSLPHGFVPHYLPSPSPSPMATRPASPCMTIRSLVPPRGHWIFYSSSSHSGKCRYLLTLIGHDCQVALGLEFSGIF